MKLCGLPFKMPDAGKGACCMDAAAMGPQHCTCWAPVYDLTQLEPDPMAVRLLEAGVQPVTRPAPCHDCAYRPGSPERRGAPGYAGNQAMLDAIVERGERFWCHQGMRKPVAYRHPSGAVVAVDVDGYDPPRVDGVPYRSDGSPGEVCAGWAKRRRALEATR